MANSALIRALPKAELHLHLEGTIEPETLVDLSRRHDADPLTLEQAHRLYKYPDFYGFMMAFKAVTQRLLTPEDFELVTYRMVERLHSQRVLHAEVYISVGVVHWRQHEFEPLFEGIERGRERGERDFGLSVLWIFDAVRHFGIEAARPVFELAVRYKDRNVIGVGIGGDERKGPAEPFRALYDYAAEHGLRRTAHAGEMTGPESIWAALNIGAERLGHVLSAPNDAELMKLLAERQIPVEMCMSSNLHTGCLTSLQQHPVRRMFDQGLLVTLNSDDPTMFQTSLNHEYELAQDLFEFTDEHLRELARNSFEASFLPPENKVRLLKAFDHAMSELTA
ncbi:MAG TPA: adenosine deaminase [Terriglobales bacterium]|nr:adenosine deaminase [Terriglobales bacterium]